ncbi:hypothetical protein BKA56DRAFT_81302 [Ilyonectria sp. MPI-CAGE-AT-0026]|nr:hypothetical protein BKA56DRAFT_81302 [Ilyonectria sp. MPI-CAGE-AT-0026]
MHHSTADDNISASVISNDTSRSTENIPLVAGTAANDSGGSSLRLSWWLRFVILLSLLVLTESAIFLSWLWFEDPSTDLWRRVVLGSFLTKAITITGVLIRTAIGSLAVISTSMIASVALESHGVPLDAIAEVSIARFTNGGPQSLFMLLLSGKTFKAPIRFLATTLLLAVLASQFTSTLLVTDLEITRISSFNQTINNSFNFDQSTYDILGVLNSKVRNYWERRPDISETFAEYSEIGMSVEGVDDTGPTIRALIPLALQSEREGLRTFEGISRVIDVRVLCIRPEPIIDLRFCHSESEFEPIYRYQICGNATARVSNLPVRKIETRGSNGIITTSFTCPLSGYSDNDNSWMLCSVPGNIASNLTIDTTRPTNMGGISGASWLIFNEHPFKGQGVFDPYIEDERLAFLNATQSGPWLRQWSRLSRKSLLDGTNVTMDFPLDMAWCFAPGGDTTQIGDGERLQNLNIKASSLYNRTEPTYTWDANSSSYDTSAIRNQLGLTSLKERVTNSDRGILTISPQDMKKSLAEAREKARGPPYQDGDDYYGWMDFIFPDTTNLALCPTCQADDKFQVVNSASTSLFAETIKDTNSPALALQGLLTSVMRMVYYDYNTFFPSTDKATVTHFVYVQAPQSTRGYMTVMATIAINVLIFVVLYFWHRGTRFSFIGNVWQSIAQVSESRETQQILRNALFLEDKDLKECSGRDRIPEGVILKTRYYSKKTRDVVFDFFKGWESFERRSDKTLRFVVDNGIVKRVKEEHEGSI